MSGPEQTTKITDNVNQGYIAGRDLYLGDQYVVQETLFFEPDLKDVEPDVWVTTPKAEELARILASHRLIVLAGQDLDDKTMVARHLAWLLRQELPGEVRVREWYRSSDPQKIETAFHETDTTILLLPQVQPHHVGHRLTELSRVLQSRRNYAVITTEATKAEWGIGSGSPEEHLWHEVSWETYYGRRFLAATLLAELAQLNGRRPEWLAPELDAGSALVKDVTVEEAAVRLKQPDRIYRFVEWLGTQEASPPALLGYIDQLGGDRVATLQWYRQLDRTDQLFALGLVLFDGLPDDQIFAALELLVAEAWRKSDPNLPLFDYRDLQRLNSSFHLTETGEDGTRIETPSRQKRDAIFQAAWEYQRRRLLAVVPALTRLLQDLFARGAVPEAERTATKVSKREKKGDQASKEAGSGSEMWRFTRGPERELFSSPRRAEQLQRAIIEALSRIGLLSFEAVEASFLELAVAGSAELQAVVAKALAAWRGDGHSEELFRVLLAWWRDGCVAASARSLVQKTMQRGEEPHAIMRATVALTVGYALQFDPPNQLAPELQSLLKVLVQDGHPAVRARVLELTLPMAAASHLRQLEAILRHQAISDPDHLFAVAFGTSMAFSLRPPEALEVIERWHAFSRSQVHPEEANKTVTPRDRLLSVVALSYGYIRHDQSLGLLTPDEIVASLRAILSNETNPFVRTHTLMALGLQAVDHFELVASTLVELISEITLADRLHVVSVLTRAYLRQREQLEGGDEELVLGERKFQIWTRSLRPLTAIEAALYAWLRDEGHPVAQQVAIQTFAAMSASELERREREMASRRPPVVAIARQPIVRIAANPPRLHRLSLLGRLAALSATPRRKEIRAQLLPVLAEVIEVRRVERSRVFETVAATAGGAASQEAPPGPARPVMPAPLLPMVLKRWQGRGDEAIQHLSRSLGIALDIFRWRWAILATAVLACYLVYYDIEDWRWAHGVSMSFEDQRAVEQRSAAPLRLVWDLSLPELRGLGDLAQHEAEQRSALEKAMAGKLAAISFGRSSDDTEGSRPAPPPAERLLRGAWRAMALRKDAQFFSGEEEVGRSPVLPSPEREDRRAQASERQVPDGANQPPAHDELASFPEEEPTREPALRPRVEIAGNPVEIDIPLKKPSWFQKLQDRRAKKKQPKPPTGDDHGNR